MLDTIKNALPPFAKDLKLNLSSLLCEEVLNPTQRYGVLVASALAAKNAGLIRAAVAEAAANINASEIENAKAANAIMGMTNIYYRFLHMAKDAEFGKMPAGLRMQIIGNPPADKHNFELYALAVSAVNGCEFCVAAHVNELKKAGLSHPQIQAAIRLSATVHAIAGVLESEAALNGTLVQAA
ncbi:MAG: alkyl hydroperoxide reductase [Alphaproteobacteria bacterium]|nr:MAG: alkyl hydroperoxide reductase [Alphaproteobacteria bacterium]